MERTFNDYAGYTSDLLRETFDCKLINTLWEMTTWTFKESESVPMIRPTCIKANPTELVIAFATCQLVAPNYLIHRYATVRTQLALMLLFPLYEFFICFFTPWPTRIVNVFLKLKIFHLHFLRHKFLNLSTCILILASSLHAWNVINFAVEYAKVDVFLNACFAENVLARKSKEIIS